MASMIQTGFQVASACAVSSTAGVEHAISLPRHLAALRLHSNHQHAVKITWWAQMSLSASWFPRVPTHSMQCPKVSQRCGQQHTLSDCSLAV